MQSSERQDEINDVLREENGRVVTSMTHVVIRKGARSRDMAELGNMKEIQASFDSLINMISDVQLALRNTEVDPVPEDLKIITEAYQSLNSRWFDRIPERCQEKLVQLDSSFSTFNTHDNEWLFIELVSVEAKLVDLETCFADYFISRVGSADLSFDITPYGAPGFGVELDSSEMDWNEETYDLIIENPFQHVSTKPLSTFSADVDQASYANIRRFLTHDLLPPKDAVRIEELVNSFEYDYANPVGDIPVSIETELTSCPWNEQHQLLRVGLKSESLLVDTSFEELPANNLVFLIDVSGSMEDENKLPLIKSSLKLLTNKLRANDVISIVVYAGEVGVAFPPTAGSEKEIIFKALDQLEAEGSTAGAAGIQLAYKLATETFIKTGNNRVIIATDGDFNVGASSKRDLFDLIGEKRKTGVYLTVLGFGMGNYKDAMLRVLSNHGNGNYAYIDELTEAREVFESGFTSTLYTVANDVKIQVEFNPVHAQGYRLLGYEDRILPPEDYQNDQVDAGDMGSGHQVTALYELIPVGVNSKFLTEAPELKYQKVKTNKKKEFGTIRFRYKLPNTQKSKEVVHVISMDQSPVASSDQNLATAVAEYALLLRDSKYKNNATFQAVIDRIEQHMNERPDQKKWEEFLNLIKKAASLCKS